VDPRNRSKSLDALIFYRKYFANKIPLFEVSKYNEEIELYRISPDSDYKFDITPSDSNLVESIWANISKTNKYPTLCKMIRTLLVLPHGNADIERVFSYYNDIRTKKRNRIALTSIQAYILCKQHFKSLKEVLELTPNQKMLQR
jgi:hypothetical protein